MPNANRIVASLLLVLAVAGCRAQVEPPKGSCSPAYELRSGMGSFTARQPGPGAPVDWGLYPMDPALRFELQVYVGNRLVDERAQTTPPSGTVRAEDVAGEAGQDLTVSGRLLDGKHNTVEFRLQCTLA
jgi:hypothetical protein